MENDTYNFNAQHTDERAMSFGLAKVFGFLFLGLGVTAGVAYGMFALVYYGLLNADVYVGLFFASTFLTIIASVVTQLSAFRNNKLITGIGYAVYTILWGVILSYFMFMFEFSTLGLSFLVTAGSFGAMAVYGLITKRSTTTLGMIGSGLLFGALAMTIVNFFLGSTTLFWILSYVIIAAMLLIVAYEVNQAKFMADRGLMTTPMAIYWAFQLYADFIMIFLRVVMIVASSNRR
jgi:FtsH-binding integral membrane protein